MNASMRRQSQVKTPWRISAIILLRMLGTPSKLTFRFAIMTSPGRRIELCGDAPRAPAQRPGFGGRERSSRPLPMKSWRQSGKIPGVWGQSPQFPFAFRFVAVLIPLSLALFEFSQSTTTARPASIRTLGWAAGGPPGA